MRRKEKIPPCPHCGTAAVHGNIADCVPVLKAERDALRRVLTEIEASARVMCTFGCSRHEPESFSEKKPRPDACNICLAFANLEAATKKAGSVLQSSTATEE